MADRFLPRIFSGQAPGPRLSGVMGADGFEMGEVLAGVEDAAGVAS